MQTIKLGQTIRKSPYNLDFNLGHYPTEQTDAAKHRWIQAVILVYNTWGPKGQLQSARSSQSCEKMKTKKS